jgi:hypothetical protein
MSDLALRSLIALERKGWEELRSLIGSLTPVEVLQPGYYLEGWSAKDVLAHIAGWLAEAGIVLEQIRAGTFVGRDLDVDAMNAIFLKANATQPMNIVQAEAEAARSRLLLEVQALEGISDEAAVWLSKAGPEHYDEHMPRLREWVAQLRGPAKAADRAGGR